MKKTYRIGQIVPSSNITMETEIPALLRSRETIEPERFTFHSSRMRMKRVTKEELAAMDADSDRCALELSDAALSGRLASDGVRLDRLGFGFAGGAIEATGSVRPVADGSVISAELGIEQVYMS